MTVPGSWRRLETGSMASRRRHPERQPAHPSQCGASVTGPAGSSAAALGLLEAKLLDATDYIGGAGTIWVSPADIPGLGTS